MWAVVALKLGLTAGDTLLAEVSLPLLVLSVVLTWPDALVTRMSELMLSSAETLSSGALTGSSGRTLPRRCAE